MKIIDDAMARERLDLDLDGELAGPEKNLFEERLEKSPELAAEHRALRSLHAMLDDSRIEVRPEFQSQVMSALPEPVWARGRQRVPTWALPVAMIATLVLGAALVLSLGGASAADSQVLGVTAAVFDFLVTTFLAGAGLLFATWRGVGFGIEQMVADSGLNLLALASFVLFLDLLFVSLLRRRSPAGAREKAERGS